VGGYGQEIHEMTEMRAVAMGQYGHNNQPTHHLLYLFALLGDHDTTAAMVGARAEAQSLSLTFSVLIQM